MNLHQSNQITFHYNELNLITIDLCKLDQTHLHSVRPTVRPTGRPTVRPLRNSYPRSTCSQFCSSLAVVIRTYAECVRMHTRTQAKGLGSITRVKDFSDWFAKRHRWLSLFGKVMRGIHFNSRMRVPATPVKQTCVLQLILIVLQRHDAVRLIDVQS